MRKKNHKKIILLVVFMVGILVAAGFFTMKKETMQKAKAEIYVTDRMDYCKNAEDVKNCYHHISKEFLDNYDLSTILEVFGKHENSEPFFSNCHLTSHYLGQESYLRTKNIKDVFSQASRICLGGVYHGAVEGFFMSKGIALQQENLDLISKEIKNLCGDADFGNKQQFTECNHGMGHALMYVADYDLPIALKLCDALSSSNEQELCYTGALMANYDSADSSDHPSKYVRSEDPLYPCNILETRYQKQCYTYGVISSFQFEPEKSVAICNSIPKDFRADCFSTYGRDRTMVTSNSSELIAQCELIDNLEFKINCLNGASYNLIVRFGVSDSIPFGFCKAVDPLYKDGCYANLERAASNQFEDAKFPSSFCDRFMDNQYSVLCKEKTRL